MGQEKEVLTRVTETRAQVGQIKINVEHMDHPALIERFSQAKHQIGSALSRMLAVEETYIELKSDGLFLDLMTQLEGTENRIATERGRYVQAVQNYNVFIRQFPNVITAKVLGYPVLENYGMDRETELMRNPEVRFGNSR